jgi:hypothetical protein
MCSVSNDALKEESRPSVFEDKELSRIFGSERDEVTEEWRRLHNVELCDLYCSPNIYNLYKYM